MLYSPPLSLWEIDQMTVGVGDRVPELTLASLGGQPTQLAQAWRAGKAALEFFLRHLG